MSLLLLFKPHPNRVGRGQQLIIQGKGSGDLEIFTDMVPDLDVAQIGSNGPVELVPSAEALVRNSPYFVGRPEEAAEFKKIYKQGLQEGLTIEEMLLLFMMTER